MERADEILRFWFGEFSDDLLFDKSKLGLWFKSGSSFDEAIKTEFEDDVELAVSGQLDDWTDSPEGRLALILLLDQFPKHIYRDTPKAYAHSERAQQIALKGISQGDDYSLHPIERIFLYMPLANAEDLDLQHRSVQAYEGLVKSLPTELRPHYEPFLNLANENKEVIKQFGRFPQLNAVLDRSSSDEEISFLNKEEPVI